MDLRYCNWYWSQVPPVCPIYHLLHIPLVFLGYHTCSRSPLPFFSFSRYVHTFTLVVVLIAGLRSSVLVSLRVLITCLGIVACAICRDRFQQSLFSSFSLFNCLSSCMPLRTRLTITRPFSILNASRYYNQFFFSLLSFELSLSLTVRVSSFRISVICFCFCY